MTENQIHHRAGAAKTGNSRGRAGLSHRTTLTSITHSAVPHRSHEAHVKMVPPAAVQWGGLGFDNGWEILAQPRGITLGSLSGAGE